MNDVGVTIQLEGKDIDEAIRKLGQFVSFDPSPLMEAIASLGENQTQRRILQEKTAPDGTPWTPNVAGTPTLDQTGQHLARSLAYYSSGEEAVWGASWEFAHIHQEGAVITSKTGKALRFEVPGGWRSKKSVTIPARPFVGISIENRAEFEDLVSDYFGHLIGQK